MNNERLIRPISDVREDPRVRRRGVEQDVAVRSHDPGRVALGLIGRDVVPVFFRQGQRRVVLVLEDGCEVACDAGDLGRGGDGGEVGDLIGGAEVVEVVDVEVVG